jgi:HlyD family secretion protein
VGDDGQPKPTAVKLGATDDNGAELLDGQLAEGQQLIIGVANTQTSRR